MRKRSYMGGGGMPSTAPGRSRAEVTMVSDAKPHSGPGSKKPKGRSRAEVTMVSDAKPC